MIGRLAGRIEYRAEDHVLIDVRGVGYVVHCSERTLGALPAPGEAAALWTDLLVREDLLQLYGFLTLGEREWHRLLMRVQGVGAKASLAILGALGADGVSRAVALGDWSAIRAAKGIGPKTAQRVVNELKDKAPGVMALDHAAAPPPPPEEGAGDAVPATAPAPAAPRPAPPQETPARAEALSALGNLGYAPGEAAAAVAEALDAAPEADTAALIRAALSRLAPKG
ncbi:Holliday junction branch migration protein RuvA [Rhodosalinus sediminis]|uniref:Holliday junction branch migration protein RuvA n=1 Tax=Rhodosalinus sediminis TaxID=1940533 RepID=UPI002353A6F6|nr:Holliday junction branch migration protein RuvA [Rhodosalinus sediminis]